MKNKLLTTILFMAMLLVPTAVRTDTTTGGDVARPGVDSGAIARNNSRAPTADIDWANNALNNVSSLELDNAVDRVSLGPTQVPGGGEAILFDFPTDNDYSWGSVFGTSIGFHNTVSGTSAGINVSTEDNDGTDHITIGVMRQHGYVGGTKVESAQLTWRPDILRFSLDEAAFVAGAVNHPFQLTARNWTSTPNILMQIDGTTEFPAGSVIHSTSTTTTTKTGPHLFIGTTAGAPTGVPADTPAGRVALNYDTTNNELCAYDAGWNCISPGGGGETNTASNQGVGGIGVFDAKVVADLQFRNINAASTKISVALDGANKEVDIDVNEANLTITESQISDLTHTDATAIHDNVASEISAIAVKGTPVGGDFLLIEDSAAANAKKHVLVSSLPTATHASTHIDAGSDVIDADKAEISWIPTFYTRDSTTPSEADSDDDLTAHLQGVDNQFGMLATEIFQDTLQTINATTTTIRTVGIADNFVENIDFDCVAIIDDGTKGAGRQIKGTFRNPSGASTVAQIGSVTTIYSKVDTPNGYTTSMTISTDDVLLQVTGHTAETVEWRCKTEIISRDGTP